MLIVLSNSFDLYFMTNMGISDVEKFLSFSVKIDRIVKGTP